MQSQELRFATARPTRLRVLRLTRGLTQQSIAEKAGLTQTTLSAVERGMRPSYDILVLIAQALDIADPASLLDRIDVEAAPVVERS